MVLNLVANAFKFSEEGGRVKVWVRRDAEPGFLRLGVTDEGPGIAPESVTEIFERFKQVGGSVTAATKGFGLGLSIAKELVQMNLGRIEVQSAPGRGSTFSFTLPEADLKVVIAAHLRLAEQRRKNAPYLTLLSLTAPEAAAVGLLEEIDQFLPRQLRHSDLICRTTLHTWLVVLAGDDPDATTVLRRLEEARRSANRNRIVAPIPTITSDLLATAADGTPEATPERFLEAVIAAAGPKMPLELVA